MVFNLIPEINNVLQNLILSTLLICTFTYQQSKDIDHNSINLLSLLQ